MAKKIVRGITDVKTINNQDYDTNNVNDLLSDGQYSYIHRKKGKSEEYHNLTDNIKTISSDNTDLLTVTNNNKTNNTATLHPKHDAQKEQVLESTRNTVNIHHGTNGTDEKTTVDTNPQKVLEHEKLKTGDGLTTSFNTDETTIMFKSTKKPPETNLNTLGEGIIRGNGFPTDQAPSENQVESATYITLQYEENAKVQFYVRESVVTPTKIIQSYRFIKNGVPTPWKEMAVDREELLQTLSLKQDKITSNTSIGVLSNNTLRQLVMYVKTYFNNGARLRIYVKDVSRVGSLDSREEELNFSLKISQGTQETTFTLEEQDKKRFNNIITTYGVGNSVRINGCLFTLSDTTLTVSTDANTGSNLVITFSDIL